MNININNLVKGDVLLSHNKDSKHAAIYIGDGKICQASINEKGTATGGLPGDQTGHEIEIKKLTRKSWDYVLRCKDRAIAEKAANEAVKIANDNNYGYDQISRWGENGAFDCSSLIIHCYEIAGAPVKSKGGATWTGNMRSSFKKCGFYETDTKEAAEIKDPASGSNDRFYFVCKGDTLTKIAKMANTDIKTLAELNGIDNVDLIRIGQKIKLPAVAASSGKAENQEPKIINAIVNTRLSQLRIRKEPNTKCDIIGLLNKGQKIEIEYIKNNWAKLYNRAGFVSADYIKIV